MKPFIVCQVGPDRLVLEDPNLPPDRTHKSGREMVLGCSGEGFAVGDRVHIVVRHATPEEMGDTE